VAEIQSKGGHANAISADLGTPEGAALLAKQLRSTIGRRLDVLVLNAGISKSARITDHTIEDFDPLCDKRPWSVFPDAATLARSR
jgi:3-oxoacyl-[acyl-carrier protein] reductase